MCRIWCHMANDCRLWMKFCRYQIFLIPPITPVICVCTFCIAASLLITCICINASLLNALWLHSFCNLHVCKIGVVKFRWIEALIESARAMPPEVESCVDAHCAWNDCLSNGRGFLHVRAINALLFRTSSL